MKDQRSNTARNISFLKNIANINVVKYATWKVRQMLPVRVVPTSENWRASLLSALLKARYSMSYSFLNLFKNQSEEMISSLCKS